jgi:DNA-binding CsgD family transcriptional regulator
MTGPRPMPTAQAVLQILEAVYRIEQPPESWLTGVAQALLPSLGRGLGLHCYFVDVTPEQTTPLGTPYAVGLDPEWEAQWRENWWEVFMAPVDAATMRWLHRFTVCSFAREVWDAGAAAHASYAEYLAALAASGYGRTHHRYLRDGQVPSGQKMFYPDSFNMSALDATGRGCVFIFNLPEATTGPVPEAEAAFWGQIAGHISAAHRLLRARVQDADVSPFDTAEAILDPSGHIHHAGGAAKGAAARASIRAATRSLERARGQTRTEPLSPPETLSAWQAMTSGRWTLVDQFDSDGRRFILARPNAPGVDEDPVLTTREQQVAGHAALGHSNKVIAYELGLTASTVATYLSSAARKLGARNRIELIRAFLARLQAHRPVPPSDET